jgi:hypothetical protein
MTVRERRRDPVRGLVINGISIQGADDRYRASATLHGFEAEVQGVPMGPTEWELTALLYGPSPFPASDEVEMEFVVRGRRLTARGQMSASMAASPTPTTSVHVSIDGEPEDLGPAEEEH